MIPQLLLYDLAYCVCGVWVCGVCGVWGVNCIDYIDGLFREVNSEHNTI